MIKLNDIFISSYGYDATCVAYYQVTKVISDKTVEVTPIASKNTDDNHVMPALNKFYGESFKRRIKKWYDGTPAINCERDYMQAVMWNGSASYETPINQR